MREPRIVIVGAGMSGLCMGATLKRAGIHSFTILEKGDGVGGTWRENTYPGLFCDVPSRFYQFTFAPNPDWSRFCSPGGEIRRYFEDVADRTGVRGHLRLRTPVAGADWDGTAWQVRLADGETLEADFLVPACGILHHPRVPDLPGMETFAGALFHSARWDHSVPLAGRRVGVVGSGSTGAQIVAALGGVASHLTLFQRTPQWIAPLPNPRFSRLTRALHRRFGVLDRITYQGTRATFEWMAEALIVPGWKRRAVQAICRHHLRLVRDPELRARLTPSDEPMCRRLIGSSGFYPAIQRDDVFLVTEGIERIVPEGIVTRDGTLHELDVLALATGFDAHAYLRPMRVTGRDGVTLEDAWAGGPRAYRSVALPGFPNLFLLMGPHSPVGNYSLTAIAENQAAFALGWIERWRAGAVDAVAPTPEATARFNAEMRAALPGTVWTTGCTSWYLGEDGLPELWPWTPDHHRTLLEAVDEADYELTTPA